MSLLLFVPKQKATQAGEKVVYFDRTGASVDHKKGQSPTGLPFCYVPTYRFFR